MKHTLVYLTLVALTMAALMSVTGALAQDVTCKFGSYGKIAAQADGRC